MRMQLIRHKILCKLALLIKLAFLIFLFTESLKLMGAETDALQQHEVDMSTLKRSPKTNKPVKMDFLSGYYEQDGNHSAVTGGEGTESLKDFATVIRINIPLKPDITLQLDSRISYFTSASLDNIDPGTISGASRNDVKVGMDATITRNIGGENTELSYRFGLSHEAHFLSVNTGFGFSRELPLSQSKVYGGAGYVMDIWGQYYDISRLYPSDYRGPDNLDNNKRHSLRLNIGYDKILNEKLKVSLGSEIIQQFGLLSAPFHRIYFEDTDDIDIERLPDYRFRMPITGRMSWYTAQWLTTKAYYRFYWDNFGLKGHTVYMELPFKPTGFLSIYPFYRYHYQYGNKYFAPKGEHLSSEEYYSSDHDQADLQSHSIGGGLKWIPYSKKRSKKENRLQFNAIEARGSWYKRSDGFHSWVISGSLSWSILRRTTSDENLPKQ